MANKDEQLCTSEEYYTVDATPDQWVNLQSLPSEVLKNIINHFDLYRDWSPYEKRAAYRTLQHKKNTRDLLSLSVVSRRLRSHILPVLFYSVRSGFDGNQTTDSYCEHLQVFLGNPRLLECVRHLDLLFSDSAIVHATALSTIYDLWGRVIQETREVLQSLCISLVGKANSALSTDEFVKHCADGFPRVRYLRLTGDNVSPLIRLCPRLDILELDKGMRIRAFMDEGIDISSFSDCVDAASEMSSIRHLNVMERKRELPTLAAISKKRLPIKVLCFGIEDVGKPRRVSPPGFIRPPVKTLARLLNALPNLEELRIMSMYGLEFTTWKLEGAYEEVKPKTRKINYRRGNRVALCVACDIFKHMPRLKRLHLEERRSAFTREWVERNEYLTEDLNPNATKEMVWYYAGRSMPYPRDWRAESDEDERFDWADDETEWKWPSREEMMYRPWTPHAHRLGIQHSTVYQGA